MTNYSCANGEGSHLANRCWSRKMDHAAVGARYEAVRGDMFQGAPKARRDKVWRFDCLAADAHDIQHHLLVADTFEAGEIQNWRRGLNRYLIDTGARQERQRGEIMRPVAVLALPALDDLNAVAE